MASNTIDVPETLESNVSKIICTCTMNALMSFTQTLRQNFFFKLYQHYVIASILLVKQFGFKELLRRRGLKFFCVIIGYYLVRDTLLYVLIPYAIARGLF